ncbi:1-(5-phosphoribosyl)-5-[(5-phosphoribosylamino)methylideneamino] imidazole-4-carboxamide isomerase [Flavobacterium rivuli WB 3.3-2 = DSM 21788]|uniref:1-(5-phosphoribosyl)-5-[(5-phosphoribosylamino)methylideneamino] imidazole-4-carboxamide isomerase n=1 Tax=Flavobacterium rivuli WB 3.3-2 = DSM 21788 TaxID=1121895 RepID=A0A0A2M8Y0_9FLAO|nr:1-(5-phosphoribosyl)-5-[(5-phosphoribosylamino)methylideneamino]imidazole-4-carboxamide isomerase [Flavobacterium rivuli]KGO88704.1 1-(5-phosphoribosyl)-5-[(5-phosphoribosylamino)methylideneamino] imidazole-4-carboxamide isomerase [Flavobacterium rivuli WB 3.3-2 = DSM 21788]
MRIIPAIDIIDGKCVRLTKGDYSTQKTYNNNPVEVAKEFEAAGIKYLHVVDLDGAKSGHIVNHKVLKAITNETNLIIDFGGGVKTDTDLELAFNNGASQVTAGSIAVKSPAVVYQWIETYGADKIILGADCMNRKIAIQGWQDNTEIDVIDFITLYKSKGISTVICTDIAKDGMLLGAANELYTDILSTVKINLIASGGIATIDDVLQMQQLGCKGVIIGKAIYEGRITLKQLSELC